MEFHQESCRLCLSVPQHRPEIKVIITEDIIEKIVELINHKLIGTKGYSNFICVKCHLKLREFSSFRNNVIEAQRTLELFLCRIKEDPDELERLLNENSEEALQKTVVIKQEHIDYSDGESFLADAYKKELFPSESPPRVANVKRKSKRKVSVKKVVNHVSLEKLRPEKSFHKRSRNQKCVDCNSRFFHRADVFKHWKDQHYEAYKIESNRSEATVEELFNQRELVACELCGATMKESSLRNHIRHVHLKERSAECDVCGRKTTHRSIMEAHMKIHLPPELRMKLQCKLCPRRFANKQSLGLHMKGHGTPMTNLSLPCHCGRVFSSEHTLKSHKQYYHNREKFSVECRLCGRFMRKSELKSHTENVHMDIDQKNYQCDDCGRFYYTKSILQLHIRKVHLQKKNISCDFGCKTRFSTLSKLKVHMDLVHLKIRSFICTQKDCSKAYATRTKLVTHIATYHEKLRQNCPIDGCKFSVGRRDNMRTHLKKHGLKVEEFQHYMDIITTMRLA